MVGMEDVRAAIQAQMTEAQVDVTDISNGCGTSFEVRVVSPDFEGKRLLDRHKLVNAALKDLMPEIHALSITRAWTPQQAVATS